MILRITQQKRNKMRAWINKEQLRWFKEMQDEGRTRSIPISTFPTLLEESNKEYEIEIKIKKSKRIVREGILGKLN